MPDDVVWVESELGRQRGAPTAPLVLFGHVATRPLADVIAGSSTLRCVLAPDPAALERLLAAHEVAGLVAHSRAEHPGEAGRAIAAARRLRPTAAALYGAWDYHVERGARRALEDGADGVLMPAIHSQELFPLLFGVLERRGRSLAPPATVEEHVALVRRFAPTSPFWGQQDLLVSDDY